MFKEQYSKFKGIIDYKTSNHSFIKMLYILKSLNVQNRYFFLYLSQPELQGVDPYSKNLTDEQKTKIGVECKINPWYIFREVIRIPASGVLEGIPFILNRANLALIWCFFNYIDVFLTIPRQRGKTTSTSAILDAILFILGKSLNISAFS